MKKILSLLLLLLVLSGCSSVKTKEEWESIQLGMSTKEIENILGKPRSSTDDNNAISENAYSSIRGLEKLESLLPDDNLTKRIKQLNNVRSASESGQNVKEFKYKVATSDGEREAEIYFIGGSVEYINREHP